MEILICIGAAQLQLFNTVLILLTKKMHPQSPLHTAKVNNTMKKVKNIQDLVQVFNNYTTFKLE